MPQSLARVLTHLIFSTKHREACIPPDLVADLNAYFVGVLRKFKCPAVQVGAVTDHVHILFVLGRTRSTAEVVEEAKTTTSKWIKLKATGFEHFHWQSGYGVFSVSSSNADEVIEYIRTQAKHHRRVTFQEEYRAFLERHEVDYDERYVWD